MSGVNHGGGGGMGREGADQIARFAARWVKGQGGLFQYPQKIAFFNRARRDGVEDLADPASRWAQGVRTRRARRGGGPQAVGSEWLGPRAVPRYRSTPARALAAETRGASRARLMGPSAGGSQLPVAVRRTAAAVSRTSSIVGCQGAWAVAIRTRTRSASGPGARCWGGGGQIRCGAVDRPTRRATGGVGRSDSDGNDCAGPAGGGWSARVSRAAPDPEARGARWAGAVNEATSMTDADGAGD